MKSGRNRNFLRKMNTRGMQYRRARTFFRHFKCPESSHIKCPFPDRGQLIEAESALRRSLSLNSNYKNALMNMGVIQFRNGDYHH